MHNKKLPISAQKIYTVYPNLNTSKNNINLRYFSTSNAKKLLNGNIAKYVYIKSINAKKNINVNSVFFTKSKKLNSIKKIASPNHSSMTYKNFVGLGKHFVPSVKEWSNSIYSFNKENIKPLPYFDKLVFNLMKGYLNFYNIGLEKNAISIRARKRRRKASINKTLVGKPNFKHTNDRVLINVYFYNRRVKYYINKIYKANTIENIHNKKNYRFILRYLKYNMSNIISLIMKNKSIHLNNNDYKRHTNYIKFIKNTYIKNFVYKFMQKEINSLIIRQLNFIQKSKINKTYLLPLLKTIEVLYKKKVNLNFVNVKYIYNNVGVFSESIMSKLKKRTVKPTRVLRRALSMFRLPPVDRLVLYDEMFNRKTRIQSRTVKGYLAEKKNIYQKKDILDNFITNNVTYVYLASEDNTNKAISSLKHKFSDGIRLEMAGRLTKRNTAERSIHKLRYRGNIRNLDSSYKGLSATLLRGYSNSNVQYRQSKSRIRIGSFGLKTWISSTT